MGAFSCTTVPKITIGPGSECGCLAVSDVTSVEPPLFPEWVLCVNIDVFDTCGKLLSTGSVAQVDCLSIAGLVEDDRPTSDAVGQVYTLTFTDPFAGEVVVTYTVVAADIVPEDVETPIATAISETVANIYAKLYAAYKAVVAPLDCQPAFEIFLGTAPCTTEPCDFGIRSTYPGIPLVYVAEVTNTPSTLAEWDEETVTENVCNSELNGSVEICPTDDTILCAIGSYVIDRPNIYRVTLAINNPPGSSTNTLYRINGSSIPAVPVTLNAGDLAATGTALAAGFNNAVSVLGADPTTAFAYPNGNGLHLYLTQDFINAYSVNLAALTLQECELDGITCLVSATAAISTSTTPYVAATSVVSVSDRVCYAFMPKLELAADNAFVSEAQGCTDSLCLTRSAQIWATIQGIRRLLALGDYEAANKVLAQAKVQFLPSNPCAPVGRCA